MIHEAEKGRTATANSRRENIENSNFNGRYWVEAMKGFEFIDKWICRSNTHTYVHIIMWYNKYSNKYKTLVTGDQHAG